MGRVALPASAVIPEERSLPWRRPLALALVLGGLAISLTSVVVWASGGFIPLPMSFISSPATNAAVLVMEIAYLTIGGILAARVRNCPVGWLFLGIGLVLTTVLPVSLLVAASHETLRPAPFVTQFAAWLVSSAGAPLVVSMFVVAAFLFPDGRLPSRRAGLAVKLAAVAAGLLTAALALDPRGLEWYPSLPNPLAVPPDLEVIVLAGRITAVPLLLACVGFLLASLADRYRHGGPEMRAQLRWFLFAGVIVLVTLIPALVGRYFLVLPDEVGEAVFVAAALGLTTFPVTAAIAISRYHLFDIDRVITRALIYIPLMAVAGGLYTTFVVLFQRVFVAATGETSDAVIVLTTLALAVGFTYARRALEGFVDRRFNPRHASAAAHPGRQVQAESAHQAASVDSAAALGQRVSALESAVTHLEDMLQGRAAGSVDVNARLQDVGEWSDAPPHPHEGRSGSATSTVAPPDSAG